jgi:hypothetical protein
LLRLAQVACVESGKLAVDTAFIEDVLCKDAPRPAAARTVVFPTPAGATWPEVRVVIGELSLKAEVRAVRREYDFKQLGFANNRRGGSVPNAKWEFLRLLARYGGVLSFDETRLTRSQRDNLKNYVKNTRGWLQAFFGLDEDDPCRPGKSCGDMNAGFNWRRRKASDSPRRPAQRGTTFPSGRRHRARSGSRWTPCA